MEASFLPTASSRTFCLSTGAGRYRNPCPRHLAFVALCLSECSERDQATLGRFDELLAPEGPEFVIAKVVRRRRFVRFSSTLVDRVPREPPRHRLQDALTVLFAHDDTRVAGIYFVSEVESLARDRFEQVRHLLHRRFVGVEVAHAEIVGALIIGVNRDIWIAASRLIPMSGNDQYQSFVDTT